MWSNSADSMLLVDDFDLNAIPAIELGLPKFGEDVSVGEMAAGASAGGAVTTGVGGYSEEFGQALEEGRFDEALFGFDEMMAGHGF